MNDVKFNKIVISVNSLVPLALLAWDALFGKIGANPIEFFLRTTGVLTLVFLFITLSVTPLRKYYGWNQLVKFRRMLGLYSFFYGFLHLITYSIFDKSLSFSGIVGDVWERPFIAVGMISFFLLVPLAITSTNRMIKRLGGKNWQKLHRLTYVAAIGGVVHFYMIVKSDVTYPLLFGLVLAVLLGYRVYANNSPIQATKTNLQE
ncbi:MAG: sulfoxide reductase heme-binding subunit YedZ [Acidobacteriota bacterium]|nr:sulfoxide reductase heme-binding subunit YedZ [Acidobacteriota bacterium]MDQ3374904.1 sulfoxide reductase heme-binding subunit YedZ [Acidobacteriota bacterium]